MQRLLEIPQEVYDFLRNFRLRAGDLNRDSPDCLLLPLRGNSPCGGSKTAPPSHIPCQECLLPLQVFLFCNRPFFG